MTFITQGGDQVYTAGDLAEEIEEARAGLEQQSQWAPTQWIIAQVLANHQDEIEDSIFARFCAEKTVGAAVTRLIRSIKRSEEDPEDQDPLIIVPGHKHLQKEYVIQREVEVAQGDGTVKLVSHSGIIRLDEMTVAEIRQKAQEHQRAGDGHYAHAEELNRYADAKEDNETETEGEEE